MFRTDVPHSPTHRPAVERRSSPAGRQACRLSRRLLTVKTAVETEAAQTGAGPGGSETWWTLRF
jgi:hypothetical protein